MGGCQVAEAAARRRAPVLGPRGPGSSAVAAELLIHGRLPAVALFEGGSRPLDHVGREGSVGIGWVDPTGRSISRGRTVATPIYDPNKTRDTAAEAPFATGRPRGRQTTVRGGGGTRFPRRLARPASYGVMCGMADPAG